MINVQSNETEQAYAQARAYGKDLARLYAAEKLRRKEIESTTQKLKTIFDTVPIGLAVVADDLTILEANSQFWALFEESHQCIGRSLSSLAPVDDLKKTMQSLKRKRVECGSLEVKVEKPVIRHFLVTLSSLSDEAGWVLVWHDVTERNRLEGLKNEFVNIAAHELRTPLAGIIGFASVLQESLTEGNKDMMAELIKLILQSTDRLKMIVDELVGFAAVQPDTDGLNVVEVDLERLVHKSIKVLQQKMEAKGITCDVEVSDLPPLVRGDQLILGEVIFHLLDNAVNFNKQDGRITVRLQQLLTPQQAPYATVIEVEDTGIGIPQIEQEKIFDKFYQVEEHLTRTKGGLGLGLTIARRGVEQHDGRLKVTSQLNKGATFRIILPAINNVTEVSIDRRADMAHQQTLAYAKDMARAMAEHRRMDKKLQQIKTLSAEVGEKLEQLCLGETGREADPAALGRLQNMLQELARLSE